MTDPIPPHLRPDEQAAWRWADAQAAGDHALVRVTEADLAATGLSLQELLQRLSVARGGT